MRIGDLLLRIFVTAAHQLMKTGWFFSRPRTLGAHAFALTPDRKLILVKLRYASGWRLPGGGCNKNEEPREAVLRELCEEIGMNSYGSVRLVREFKQQVHFKQDLASLFIVEDVRYRPRWSFEVERVAEVSLENLPADLAPVTSAWIGAIKDHQ